MSHERDDDLDLELEATATLLSQLGKLEPMPASLRAKLDADAARLPTASGAVDQREGGDGRAVGLPPEVVHRDHDGAKSAPFAASTARRGGRVAQWSGWLAAAACLVLAAMSWLRAPREVTKVVTVTAPVAPPPKVPSVAERRQELRQTAKDLVEVSWAATKDPAGRETTGNVVWSTSDQRGYMHFHGLAPNDRAASTYQLWIFDQERDAKYPVDGGTFDIDDRGDVIVPISAKVRVSKPTLFAVTVEKPGGVVVSKRERIVVTAAVN